MAPEHEARLRADFYDHENGEPRRRRRPAADWGVNEDIFDRMPSRFARVNRRAEHHDQVVVLRADERGGRRREVASWGADAWADEPAVRNEVVWDSQRETRRTESRVSAEVSAALDEWREDDGARGGAAAEQRAAGAEDRGAAEWTRETRRGARTVGDARVARRDDARMARGEDGRTARGDDGRMARGDDARATARRTRSGADVAERAPRVVDSWTDDEPHFDADMLVVEKRRVDSWMDEAPGEAARPRVDSWMDVAPGDTAKPKVDSWMDDVPLVPGESRTIVLGNDESAASEARHTQPHERRTVKISGHPDRVPAVRAQRPPRSAVDLIGASPDRIVAWAVALGFLLVLIAVLTTGQ